MARVSDHASTVDELQTDDGDPVEELQSAAQTLQSRRQRVEEIGVDELETLAEAYTDIAAILDRYEDRATDRDDLQGYIEFRETIADRLEAIPADVRHSDAFVEANETLTTGVTTTLSSSDFKRAREQLAPAREEVELLESLRDAKDSYRTARRAVQASTDEIAAEITRLERVEELGDADIDAPVHRLRDPIESYNERVTDAFERFRQDAPSRTVVEWLATTGSYPLVEMPSPPSRLREYLQTTSVGDEPIPTLVEYAGYSRSKLDHYVDDPQQFTAAVGPNKRFLETLDGTALTLSWPPSTAETVRWRARELVSVVGRFADDGVVSRIRAVRDLTDHPDYERLRESAVARTELSEAQREKLKQGVVTEELAALRTEHERLTTCLDECPPLDS